MPTKAQIDELRRLVKFGFYDLKSLDESKQKDLKEKIKKKKIDDISEKDIVKIAAADEMEQYKDHQAFPVKVKVGFPKADHTFRLVYELYNQSIEENYFWVLQQLRTDLGMNEVIKITDLFTASEQSSLWGNSQQRQAIQQDRVANFMRGISDMVKTGLFQIVRDIRAVDERLEYYNSGKGNDTALKGTWIDLVEGGAKSAASVYGLAQQLQMVTLPDLFFRTYIKNYEPEKFKEEITAEMKKLKESFNNKVIEVLERKLTQFCTWRYHTKKELTQRKSFTIKYLRQHYNTIKLYMSWIKPYMKNLKRLSMDERKADSPDLVSAFEGAMVEIEIMTRRKVKSFTETEEETVTENGVNTKKYKTVEKDVYAVVIANFLYRSKPSMNYHSESYQKGPIHVGRTEMEFRSYAWDKEKCDKYEQMRSSEVIDMIGEFDSTLNEIFKQFDDELRKYLTESGEKFEEEEKKESKAPPEESALDPFKGIYYGFKEIFGPLVPDFNSNQKRPEEKDAKAGAYKAAKGVSEMVIWNVYKNYKKGHGMLSW